MNLIIRSKESAACTLIHDGYELRYVLIRMQLRLDYWTHVLLLHLNI